MNGSAAAVAGPMAYEDFEVGMEIGFGSKRVTADEIIEFAREYDPQPMHLDEKAGAASLLGGLAASGWHICAIFMRLSFDAYIGNSTSQGSPGIDSVRWKRPVLADDVITGQSNVLEKRVSRSRPEMGFIRMQHLLFNQRGETVAEIRSTGIFRLRGTGHDA